MAALGFTLNQMTMLALTLMVGIVIDDAIVVLENIYRFVEEKGMPPFQAAIEGTREIGLAVMATTLSLLAVFIPVGFMGGIVGRFMSSFGLTAAAAIAISLLVSFTLTPMLAARWIKQYARIDEAARRFAERGFYGRVDAPTRRCCASSMAHRWVDRADVPAGGLASTYPLYKMSGVNFVPDEDESQFQINVRAAGRARVWRRRSRCSIASRATCASSCRACRTRWRSRASAAAAARAIRGRCSCG